jgi:hypothetical protein
LCGQQFGLDVVSKWGMKNTEPYLGNLRMILHIGMGWYAIGGIMSGTATIPIGTFAVVAAGLVLSCGLGCSIDTHKNGNSDDVKIDTPFGGMQVKTNDAVTLDSVGLPAYPEAVPVKKDKDNGAADVNMSFGSFQLRVRALSYRTSDSPDKVEAFYRNGMKRYGDVIKCDHDRPIGKPTETSDGLTCENKKENHITTSDDPGEGKVELKTGSRLHQHIVAIDHDGTGTKFGLVSLDLPGKAFSENSSDNRQ